MGLVAVLFDEPGEIFIDGTLGGPLDEVDGDVDGEESELFVAIFFFDFGDIFFLFGDLDGEPSHVFKLVFVFWYLFAKGVFFFVFLHSRI